MALFRPKKQLVNCRLCLAEIEKCSVVLLAGIIKDMMEIVLPEMNFLISDTPSVCNSCLDALKQSYSFKSSCLEVEDKVHDFVNPASPSLVDLKEVFKKVNSIEECSDKYVVCRTCLGLGVESRYTKLCSYEGDFLQNMVEKCVPEVGLKLCKDPSICPMCLEQLEEQFHFIMQCLDTEAKIDYYSKRKQIFKDLDLHDVYSFSICMEEGEINTDDLSVKTKPNCNKIKEENHIKKEGDDDFIDLTNNVLIKTKSKIESDESDVDQQVDTSESMEVFIKNKSKMESDESYVRQQVHTSKPTEAVTFEVSKDANGDNIITSHTSRLEDSDDDSDASVSKETDLLVVRKVTSTRQSLRKSGNSGTSPKVKSKEKYDADEDEESEKEKKRKRRVTRKCKICDFKTKFPSRMKAHMTRKHAAIIPIKEIEERRPEEKIFKCRVCPFHTTELGTYKNHKRQHKKEKEQKCPHCDMIFVRCDFLKKHVSKHRRLTNIPADSNNRDLIKTYESNASKPKTNIIPPSFTMSRPRNSRNMFSINGKFLKMFKCKFCPYQTRMKSNYERHALSHKKTSEMKTYKCETCKFETIQKENYLTHMQTHEMVNKVIKCFLCSFQPATESALRQHVNQIHKSGTG